jgi:hypothetical protein
MAVKLGTVCEPGTVNTGQPNPLSGKRGPDCRAEMHARCAGLSEYQSRECAIAQQRTDLRWTTDLIYIET